MSLRSASLASFRSASKSLRFRRSSSGFSTLELVVVLGVAMIMAAISVPLVQSTLKDLRLRAAVNSVTAAIQSTRYRAIFDGCPYALTINNATNTYQIASEVTGNACAPTMTNVGGPVPFGNTSQIAMSATTSFQFSPGGNVQVTAGTQTFTIGYMGTPEVKTIQVTNYGSITVQ